MRWFPQTSRHRLTTPVCLLLACLLSTCVLSLSVFVLSTRVAAADDGLSPLDQQLLDQLEKKPTVDATERVVSRLLDATQAASEQLNEGRFGKETAALQEKILADIDSLLEQSSPPPSPPMSPSSEESLSSDSTSRSKSQDEKSSSDKGEQTRQQQMREDSLGQSESNTGEGQTGETGNGEADEEAERERRLGLTTAAWGHLPPKVREQMRSAFSEEYLPEYDALVRKYYEALARRRSERERSNRE